MLNFQLTFIAIARLIEHQRSATERDRECVTGTMCAATISSHPIPSRPVSYHRLGYTNWEQHHFMALHSFQCLLFMTNRFYYMFLLTCVWWLLNFMVLYAIRLNHFFIWFLLFFFRYWNAFKLNLYTNCTVHISSCEY